MGSKRLPHYLEVEELAALLAAASNPLHRLYFLLCARAGLRAFEAVAVRWEDIRWKDARPVALRIPHGKGDKEAMLPLHQSIAAALLLLVEVGNDGYLFPGRNGGHIRTRTAQYWIEDYGRLAGLSRTKRHLHALRHSFATHLCRADVNLREVQDLMRHSNISTTGRYLHTTPERLQGAVDSI